MSDTIFNPAQLSTYAEARALRDFINSTQYFAMNPILLGDDEFGVKPITNPNFPWLPPIIPQVGIYLPTWSGGPHGDIEPRIGDSQFLHFRMQNGKFGFNVGLWREKFKSYPT